MNPQPLAKLLKLTIGSAAAYFLFQTAVLATNLYFIWGIEGMHAGTTKGQYITSFIINLVITGGLYFWVCRLLKTGKNLGRILGTIAAAMAALGTLIYVVLTFGIALIAAVFGLIFIVANVLWLFAAWKPTVTEILV